MNGCKDCLEYLIKTGKTDLDFCPECEKKTMSWKQNSFGTFYMECSECKAVVAADLNTPCEMDEELHNKVKVVIAPLKQMPKKVVVHKLSKLFQLTVLQMKEKLETGYSVEIEHEVLNKIIILLDEYNLENIIAIDCDMKGKYPMYQDCKYPYSAMKVYK